MAVQNQRLKRALFRVIPILAILGVLLIALILVSDVQQNRTEGGRGYLWVIALTVLALAVLLISIFSRVASLLRKVRGEEPGARLAARWVRNFLVFSLPPALIVYGFSAYFLTKTVDSWFDVRIETALADSLELGQRFLDQRTLEVRNQTRRLSVSLDADDSPDELRGRLLANVSASGPVDLSIISRSGSIITTASFSAFTGLPERPGDYALLQGLERGEYAAAEPAADGTLMIRVLQRIDAPGPGEVYLLQAIYPLPQNLLALTANIESEYYRYRNVTYLRSSLKQSFLLILTLVLMLTVLLAILAALSAARRMVTPLSNLAVATRGVAAGDLSQAVETHGRDEIAFLSASFNDMTRALLVASEEAEGSRARLQAQGDYLETVLGSLSAGVLTLNHEGSLVRVNAAAERILSLNPDSCVGMAMEDVAESRPWLAPLVDTLKRHRDRGPKAWQQEIVLELGDESLVLLVRGSPLTGSDPQQTGHVVVFDDVTVLNQAQRDAAWAEVARRLAHEVKNPLTPIRLAAERLRMKLMDRLNQKDGELLDRSASTIVAQVEALRRLVDAFGDYARDPETHRESLNIDLLVQEVVHLYRQADPKLQIQLALCDGPEGLFADKDQLRQLLHNLIRNATEAMGPDSGGQIWITTAVVHHKGEDWVSLEVRDQGPGFPQDVLGNPFEPYVSSKPGGSGLGLAICRKIVTDHDGLIEISNTAEGGGRALVRLPLACAPAGNQGVKADGTG